MENKRQKAQDILIAKNMTCDLTTRQNVACEIQILSILSSQMVHSEIMKLTRATYQNGGDYIRPIVHVERLVECVGVRCRAHILLIFIPVAHLQIEERNNTGTFGAAIFRILNIHIRGLRRRKIHAHPFYPSST